MIFAILYTILVIVLSFFGGVFYTFKSIDKVNKKFYTGSPLPDYDLFKNKVKHFPIDCLLDCAHAYGYEEGKESNNVIDCGEF